MMKSKCLAGHTCTVSLMSFALRSVPVLDLIAKGHQVDSTAGRHLSDSVSDMVVVVLWGTETSGKYLSVSLVNLVKMRKYSLICCISHSFLKSVVWGQACRCYALVGVMSHFHAVWLFTQCVLNGNDVIQGDSQLNQSSAWAWDEVMECFSSYARALCLVGLVPNKCKLCKSGRMNKVNLKQQFQGPL